MLLGVMSDSHDNLGNARKAAEVFRKEKVDIVLHLGDIISPFTLAAIAGVLDEIKLVTIYGNNCGEKIGLQRVAKMYNVELYEPPHILDLGDVKILMLHGFGDVEKTKKIVYALARGGEWDIVLYGHTHLRDRIVIDGKLVVNPGETAGVIEDPSIAIINTENKEVRFIKL